MQVIKMDDYVNCGCVNCGSHESFIDIIDKKIFLLKCCKCQSEFLVLKGNHISDLSLKEETTSFNEDLNTNMDFYGPVISYFELFEKEVMVLFQSNLHYKREKYNKIISLFIENLINKVIDYLITINDFNELKMVFSKIVNLFKRLGQFVASLYYRYLEINLSSKDIEVIKEQSLEYELVGDIFQNFLDNQYELVFQNNKLTNETILNLKNILRTSYLMSFNNSLENSLLEYTNAKDSK